MNNPTNILVTTFESVAVLLGIGLIGFWIIKRKIIPGRILSSVSPLALDIALPSLIFVNILQDFQPSSPYWWQLPLWWMFFTAIAAVLTGLFMFISKKENRREFAVSLFYQNGIFFPLAILTGMFGAKSDLLISLFLFTVFYPAFFFTTYQFFFKKSNQRFTVDWNKVFHPVLIATLIAIFIVLGGGRNYVPDLFTSIFSMLGAMTVPLLMIILGGNIYRDFDSQSKFQIIEMIKFVSIKNIVFPLIFLGVLILIKSFLFYQIALIIMLQAAVPPVTAAPLVTERMGGNRTVVNQFLVASFICSLGSIPLMIYLFSIYF
ncbi:MAG: AEC family transporter [Candidatus Thermoplasmatota archaeon]